MFSLCIAHALYGLGKFLTENITVFHGLVMCCRIAEMCEDNIYRYYIFKQDNKYRDLFEMFHNATIEEIHNKIKENNLNILHQIEPEEADALFYAIAYCRVDVVKYFLDIGAVLTRRKVLFAIRSSNYEVAKYLYKQYYTNITREEMEVLLYESSSHYFSKKLFRYLLRYAVKNNIPIRDKVIRTINQKQSILFNLCKFRYACILETELYKSLKLYFRYMDKITQENLNISLSNALTSSNMIIPLQLILMGAKLEKTNVKLDDSIYCLLSEGIAVNITDPRIY